MLGEPLRDQPSARGLHYLRAAAAVKTVAWWAVGIVAAAAIASATEVGANWRVELAVGALVALLPLLSWFSGFLPALLIRCYRHEINDEAVLIQRGFFTRRHAVVPFARVQFVTMNRGLVERRFGLATVVMQTAAGSESIPLLDAEVADELRVRLTERARRTTDDI